jgi:hypothetical protein
MHTFSGDKTCPTDALHATMQALQELNIKPRFWKDLLTDEPFTRKDIIHLQVDTQYSCVAMLVCNAYLPQSRAHTL